MTFDSARLGNVFWRGPLPSPFVHVASASERRRDKLQGLKDFYLNVKVRIWSWLSYLCHIRSTAARRVPFRPPPSILSIKRSCKTRFHLQHFLCYLEGRICYLSLGLAFSKRKPLPWNSKKLKWISKVSAWAPQEQKARTSLRKLPFLYFFFFFITLKPRVEWYKILCALLSVFVPEPSTFTHFAPFPWLASLHAALILTAVERIQHM